MKVLQTIPYMLASQGGPSTCTFDLLEGLYNINLSVDLLSSRPIRGSNCDEDVVLGEGRPWMKLIKCDYITPLALSKNTEKFLKETEYELYHANTMWLHMVHATCSYARKMGKPYVLSTHGMLYPTALKVSSWKKKLLGALWFEKDVLSAACIHATCKQEMEYVRAYGYKGPIAVIPNPVIFPKGVSLKLREESSKYKIYGRKQIGFLGRLDPIKKVENIIYAIALLNEEERELLSFQVIGKFDESYEAFLRAEVKRLYLENSVTFVGFVTGLEKYERLSQMSALMVPSEQENFGMIVPEALICGTPVYASLGTPWSELNEHLCGWWTNNSPETIAKVLREILSLDDTEIREMGHRGRSLMKEKYEQQKVAIMIKNLYEWLLNEKEQPRFVYTL
ncbi:glycosyltransferase [Schleiferiaceae bacterium]|nr:glycosyltransferase [Schleiferiaceae bacterium]